MFRMLVGDVEVLALGLDGRGRRSELEALVADGSNESHPFRLP